MASGASKLRWCFEMKTPDYVSEEQMRLRLRELYGREADRSLLAEIARQLRGGDGEIVAPGRSHALLLALGFLLAGLGTIFVVFTFVPIWQ
jgi:hypothetical protein